VQKLFRCVQPQAVAEDPVWQKFRPRPLPLPFVPCLTILVLFLRYSALPLVLASVHTRDCTDKIMSSARGQSRRVKRQPEKRAGSSAGEKGKEPSIMPSKKAPKGTVFFFPVPVFPAELYYCPNLILVISPLCSTRICREVWLKKGHWLSHAAAKERASMMLRPRAV
jgi:hypothetical protein